MRINIEICKFEIGITLQRLVDPIVVGKVDWTQWAKKCIKLSYYVPFWSNTYSEILLNAWVCICFKTKEKSKVTTTSISQCTVMQNVPFFSSGGLASKILQNLYLTWLCAVNLCQKLLFLQQLTHNMTTDCSLNYKFNTWKFQAQNMMLCTSKSGPPQCFLG